MCPWIPPKAVTCFDCRVAAELRISCLCRSRERILSRDRDEGDVARRAISLDAETSRFNSKPQTVQVPTLVFELFDSAARTGPRGVLSTHLDYYKTISLSCVLDSALNLSVRPSTSLRVKPGQVLQGDMSVVPICDLYYLAGNTLANLVLDSGRLSTDSLSLGSEDLGVLVSVVLLAEIRSLM